MATKPYKINNRIVVWRNKGLAVANQGRGHRSSRGRIVVFPSHRKARQSIPGNLGG